MYKVYLEQWHRCALLYYFHFNTFSVCTYFSIYKRYYWKILIDLFRLHNFEIIFLLHTFFLHLSRLITSSTCLLSFLIQASLQEICSNIVAYYCLHINVYSWYVCLFRQFLPNYYFVIILYFILLFENLKEKN